MCVCVYWVVLYTCSVPSLLQIFRLMVVETGDLNSPPGSSCKFGWYRGILNRLLLADSKLLSVLIITNVCTVYGVLVSKL